jgi:hypothetical protein
MEKTLYVWRIWLARTSQSFAIPIPLVFLPYESKEALEEWDAWPMWGNQRTELRPTRALTITKVEYNRAIYGEN